MKWRVNLTSQLGFILVLAWAICLKISWIFKFWQLFLQQKTVVFYTLDAKIQLAALHDEWLWMEICTRANILGWTPRTDGPMDKKHGPWQDVYHNWYRTWSEQLPIQSLEASHLCKTQTAPIFCNNVVIIYTMCLTALMITTTSLTPCQTYIANVDRVCWFSSSGSLQSKAIQKYNYDLAESIKSAGFEHQTKASFMIHILSRQDT